MLNIIHETKDIIIVNKPAGQLSQGAKGFDLDLVSEVMTYNASQGPNQILSHPGIAVRLVYSL